MRKLKNCESYAGSASWDGEQKKVRPDELNTIIKAGYISPAAVAEPLEKIKKTPIYSEAEKYFKEGKIVLLSPQGSNGEFLLGNTTPFFMADGKMYVNVTRSGHWGEEKQTYTISAASELSPILQGSYITYKFLESSQRLLADPKIVEYSTRIYVDIIVNLIQSLGIIMNNASQDDNTTYIRYLCAKFFLIYVLEKEPGNSIDELAFKVAKVSTMNRMTLEIVQMREDGDGFISEPERYNSLSRFLETIMEITRSSITISRALVFSKFARLYGEPTFHAIDYFPYLLFFLETADKGLPSKHLRDKLNGSKSGGMRSLSIYLHQLEKEIIAKA